MTTHEYALVAHEGYMFLKAVIVCCLILFGLELLRNLK